MQHERPPETRTPRGPRRVGILSPGTSEFDSRAQRIARSLVALGDTVTIYSRRRPGLPREETLDGYRIVRIPLDRADARAEHSADAAGTADASGTTDASGTAGAGPVGRPARSAGGAQGRVRQVQVRAWDLARGGYWTWHRWSDRVAVIHRFRNGPVRCREPAAPGDGPPVRGIGPGRATRHLARHVGRIAADAPACPATPWRRDRLRPA